MSTAAQDSQPSGLRVSDADRDRALAELSEHFQAGRLTADEHEERMNLALKARTAGDLAELFTDLPRKPSAMTGPASQLAVPHSSPPARFSPVLIVPVVILAALVLGGIVSGHPFVIGLGPVILAFLIVRGLLGGHHHDRHRHHHHDHGHHDHGHHDHGHHHDHDRDRNYDRRWGRDQRWDQDRRR